MDASGALMQTGALVAGYGNSTVISGVDFVARRGEITVIVGPNGSGKSTLLKSLFGLCSVHSGSVEYAGRDITRMEPHEIARAGVAYLPQVKNVFTNLSVRENLVMAGYTLGEGEARGRADGAMRTFPALARHAGGRAESLSGGERQMLAMGMALVRRPDVMLFDEPTANLSPRLAGEVIAKVREMRDSFGITVVLVEQNVRRALEVGDAVTVLANGGVAFAGAPDGLRGRADLCRLYLGMR
ncbi:MAG: ABC transporter ATP-binding protein [Thaumarchaeota archaeon]|nr:ABC transporter ATP-binding protein [Nitrososphaerota archaeon]MDD9843411.1 ABC transporter ATP-binding protein [Nitrososphaerota archaeon]